MKSSESVSENNNEARKKIDYRKASLQKIAVIVGLAFIVALIVYITPMPEEYFESCDRPCHELDWPMICRVKLTLEVYKSLSRSCGGCPGNSTDCGRIHCVSADGHSRGILAANRLLPGPSIQVCENDIMVIDVVNRVPGQGLTIHWRGQPQMETPFMDGVPMITQCPIPSYTTFQYKFRAAAPGTHLYHAHSGAESSDGLYGAFVVRQAATLDPQKKHYDLDLNEHVMVISEWSHGFAIQSILDTLPLPVEAVLVNGKGIHKDTSTESDVSAPLSVFSVTPGKRYRFRAAYAGGVKGCPLTLSIEKHNLKLIALDGHPVLPKEVKSLTLGKGERADFVLNANKDIDSYWIKVSTVENCATPIYSAAVLKYDGRLVETSTDVSVNDEVTASADNQPSDLNTVEGGKCSEERTMCVSEVQSLHSIPEELSKEKMQTTIYLPFHHKIGDQHPNAGVAEMDSVTFTFPPSPLLTQGRDVPASAQCTRATCSNEKSCECVHVRKIPLGNTVELILLDQGGESDHVFHLHGYSFFIVGTNQFSEFLDLDSIKQLDEQGKLFPKKNLIDPVRKDTVTIPKFGGVALRFKANNPGYWILRDERSNQWTRGLDVILQVGETSNFVKPPSHFPKCGSYVGPHYFLI